MPNKLIPEYVEHYKKQLVEDVVGSSWVRKNYPTIGKVTGTLAGGPIGGVVGYGLGKIMQSDAARANLQKGAGTATGTAVGTAVGGPVGGVIGGLAGGALSDFSIEDIKRGISKVFGGKKKPSGRMGSVARFVERTPSAATQYGRRMQYGVGMEEPRSQYDMDRIAMADKDIAAAEAEAGGNLGYQSRAQQLAGRVGRGYSGTLGANLQGDEKYGEFAGKLFTPVGAFERELAKSKANTARMRREMETGVPDKLSDLEIIRGSGQFGSPEETRKERLDASSRLMDKIKREAEEKKRKVTQAGL